MNPDTVLKSVEYPERGARKWQHLEFAPETNGNKKGSEVFFKIFFGFKTEVWILEEGRNVYSVYGKVTDPKSGKVKYLDKKKPFGSYEEAAAYAVERSKIVENAITAFML